MINFAQMVQPAVVFLHRFSSDLPGFVGVTVGWAMALFALISLLFLAQQILFGMAAYNDALSKDSGDATMWGLLIGFLGLIPGIIYLCVRNSQQRKVCCMKCGFWHSVFEPVCPRCGEPNQAAAQATPYRQHYAGKAQKLLIAALICLGVGVVVTIIGIASFCAFVTSGAVSYGAANW